MAACDFKSGEARWLGAAGKEKAAVHSRETVYLPDLDVVLVGAHVVTLEGKPLWALYDCGKHAWFGVDCQGTTRSARDRGQLLQQFDGPDLRSAIASGSGPWGKTATFMSCDWSPGS